MFKTPSLPKQGPKKMKKNEGLNLPTRLVESGLAGVDFEAPQVFPVLCVRPHCRGQCKRYIMIIHHISERQGHSLWSLMEPLFFSIAEIRRNLNTAGVCRCPVSAGVVSKPQSSTHDSRFFELCQRHRTLRLRKKWRSFCKKRNINNNAHERS